VFEPLSAISRSSLALFFMISGYLVINKNRTVRENLKITVQRIIIPFVSFSILASLFFLFKNGRSLSMAIDPKYIFGDVMKFPDNWLWFLEVMFFLYMLNPLWQGIFCDRNLTSGARYITYFFFIFTTGAILLKFSTHTLTFFNSFTTWIGYACCYLYGALVKNDWNYKRNRYFYYILFFLGLFMEVIGDYFVIANHKNGISLPYAGYFSDNIAIPPLLMAVGLFNLFIDIKQVKVGGKRVSLMVQKTVQTFAVLSYGIYLTHEFISQTLFDILGWNVDSIHMNIYLYNGGVFALTLFGSAAITYIISRIPKLKMIIGIS